jgi:phosphate-selective porin OprO/OprP
VLRFRLSMPALAILLGLSQVAQAQPTAPPPISSQAPLAGTLVPPQAGVGLVPEATPAPPPQPVPPPQPSQGVVEGLPALTPTNVDGGATAPKPAPVAGWDDMFYLRSPDKRFSLRFTGQVQVDYRDFLNPHDTTDLDNFTVRRARMGLEATLFENYEFRFLTDFGQGQSRLVDGYLNVHYWDAAQVTAGKFKQPFSYEQLIQDRFTPFMERSLIDQLVPARDVGVMLHGQNLFNGMVDYGVATSNGVQNGDTDTNGAKDVTGRAVVRPFAWSEDSFLRLLQFGASIDGGNQFEPINPQILRTPAGIPFFKFNSTVLADGNRIRWSPEVAYFYRGLGFSAQYFHMDQQMRPAATGAPSKFTVDVPFEGYYVQATYLLTGEQRTTYSQAINPIHPFDPRLGAAGLGAWELVGRVSQLRVGDVVFAPGNARLADPATVSDEATEMTLGFNWYLNKWVRTQFNWEHAWFGQPVKLGPGPQGFFRQHDTLQGRLQFIF